MKKVLTLILAAIMLASTLCFVSCASAKKGNLDEISDYVIANYTVTNEYGSFTYAEASGDTATITKFDGSATVEKIVIPEVVDNGTRPVSGIGSQAFYYCTSAKEITLPATVTYIGAFAFAGCESLEKIVIPAKVAYIDKFAFYGCTSLKSVIFEEEYELDENGKETDKLITNCKSIGKCAFAKCESLDTFRINRVDAFGVSIPASVTEIGEGAFLECASIPALALNDELLSIGNQAFYKCEKIMSVRFPATKNLTNETIGEYIFSTSIKPVLLKTCAGTVFEEYVNKIVYTEPEETEPALVIE